MEPETTDLAQEVIEKAIAWIETAEGFAVEQAPLFVDEILRWAVVGGALQIMICVVLAVLPSCVFVRFYRLIPKGDDIFDLDFFESFVTMLSGAVSLIAIAVGLIVSLESTFRIAKAIMAPRLYILEELGKML